MLGLCAGRDASPSHSTDYAGAPGEVEFPFPKSGKPFLTRFTTPSEFLYPIIMKFPRPVMAFLARLVHFIMVHKQLVGIKQRAERLALADSSSFEEERATGIAG